MPPPVPFLTYAPTRSRRPPVGKRRLEMEERVCSPAGEEVHSIFLGPVFFGQPMDLAEYPPQRLDRIGPMLGVTALRRTRSPEFSLFLALDALPKRQNTFYSGYPSADCKLNE